MAAADCCETSDACCPLLTSPAMASGVLRRCLSPIPQSHNDAPSFQPIVLGQARADTARGTAVKATIEERHWGVRGLLAQGRAKVGLRRLAQGLLNRAKRHRLHDVRPGRNSLVPWESGQHRRWPGGAPRTVVGMLVPASTAAKARLRSMAARLLYKDRVRKRTAVLLRRHATRSSRSRWHRLRAKVVVAARVQPDLARFHRSLTNWARLAVVAGLASHLGSLPSNADGSGPDPLFDDFVCNGHPNGWAAAVCPCAITRARVAAAGGCMPRRFNLDPKEADTHDATNCPQQGAWRPSCTGDDCEESRSAEEDPPRNVHLHWWRWRAGIRGRTRHGTRIPWTRPPDPFLRTPSPNYSSATGDGLWEEWARMRRKRLLDGPYELDDPAVRVVNPICCDVKKNGKTRVCVDYTASGNNGCMPKRDMHLPTVASAIRLVRNRRTFGAKIDLSDAFFSNSTAVADRPYHTIYDDTPWDWSPRPGGATAMAGGAGCAEYGPGSTRRAWRFRVTPFGSALSPWLFCAPIERLMRYLRNFWAMDVLAFVDDVLILGASPLRVRTQLAALRACLDFLGYKEAFEKEEPCSTRWSWLGLDFHTDGKVNEVRYPEDKRVKLIDRIASFEHEYRHTGAPIPRSELASLAGKVSFASHGVAHGRIYCRRIYEGLWQNAEHLTLHQRVHMLGHVRHGPDSSLWEDIEWWKHVLHRDPTDGPLPGVRFFINASSTTHIFGDASKGGRGATIYGPQGPESFSLPWEPCMRAASSNLRELTTLLDAIDLWGHRFPPGSRLCYTSDNTTTVSCLNNGGSKSKQLLAVTRQIHSWGAEKGVTVIGRWCPGLTLIQEGSDELSRSTRFTPPSTTAWQMLDSVADHWHTVHDDPLTLPPHDDISRLLRAALRRQVADPSHTASFAVPEWPTAAWWPLVRKFRLDAEYAAGSRLLQHPDRPGVPCATKHPIIVLRLPLTSEAALSRTQRQNARRCVPPSRNVARSRGNPRASHARCAVR